MNVYLLAHKHDPVRYATYCLDDVSNATMRLSQEVSETTNSMINFLETLESIKKHYHPFFYWLYEIGLLK